MASERNYYVQFTENDATSTLGELSGCLPHHASLDPFVAPLVRAGRTGLLQLVDAASGTTVATRRITASVRRAARRGPRSRGVAPELHRDASGPATRSLRRNGDG